MSTTKQSIETALNAALQPVQLVVDDVSHHHEGHAGWRPGGETHFNISVVSEAFAGLNKVARQRLIYRALAELMRDRIHALSIVRAETPEEAGG